MNDRKSICCGGHIFLLPTEEELETLIRKGYDSVSSILDLWYPKVSRVNRERLSVRIREMLDKCPTIERYGCTFAPDSARAVVRYRVREAE